MHIFFYLIVVIDIVVTSKLLHIDNSTDCKIILRIISSLMETQNALVKEKK